MKHTTEELLLAFAVRERVAKMRLAKTADMSDEDAAAFNALPVGPLIEEALTDINNIATLISQIRERE